VHAEDAVGSARLKASAEEIGALLHADDSVAAGSGD
jgi:hypothetical protein